MKLSDALRRAVRTFLQSFVGIFVATLATSNVVDVNGVPHLSALAAIVMAAAWGGFIAVLSWAQNALEDKQVVPQVVSKT